MDQSQRPKCGTCRFFVVRNRDEVMLAQIARPESECAPGEHTFEGKRIQGCVGGGVRGICLKWRERGAQSQQVDSTFMCKLYQPGGPTIRGMEGSVLSGEQEAMGSFARMGAEAPVAPQSESLLVPAAIGAAVVVAAVWLKKWLDR